MEDKSLFFTIYATNYREADHRRDKENMYLLDSPKLEQLFQSKVSSLIRERETERREFESK